MLGGMAVRCVAAAALVAAPSPRAPLSPVPRSRLVASRRAGRAPVSPPRATVNGVSAAAAAAAEREAVEPSALPGSSAPAATPLTIFCIDNALERGVEYMTAPDVVQMHPVAVQAPVAPVVSSPPAAVLTPAAVAPEPVYSADAAGLVTTRMRWPEAWEESKKVELYGSWDNWTLVRRREKGPQCAQGGASSTAPHTPAGGVGRARSGRGPPRLARCVLPAARPARRGERGAGG
jgi:hypothetical protein